MRRSDSKPLTARCKQRKPTQQLQSKGYGAKWPSSLLHLILRVAPGRKQQEEGVGSIRDEIRKRLALAEKGDLEQLLKGAIEDQEKQKQIERRSEGPGETDKENDRLLRAAQAADRGQLRTAATLLRGSKLLPPTEATADAIEQLYQTGGEAQKRTDDAFEGTTHWPKSDVRQQHVLTHIRDAKRTGSPRTEW